MALLAIRQEDIPVVEFARTRAVQEGASTAETPEEYMQGIVDGCIASWRPQFSASVAQPLIDKINAIDPSTLSPAQLQIISDAIDAAAPANS